MACFEVAYRRTARFEGGYVNDPRDSGGETYNGISRRANPKWEGWKIVDEMRGKSGFPQNLISRKDELKKLELKLYKNNYWDTIWGDKIKNQYVANDMYDTAVNMGYQTSIRLSQRQFKIKETGSMDETLLKKLNSVGL